MFDDDPEWDLAVLCFVHDKIIEASGGSKGFNDKPSVEEIKAWPVDHSAIQKDKRVNPV